ncbi:helix-turn-helix domain-containing protein [Halocatena halophila]|uniref:helix-turn-helix domain-containing protein n=1 Tax=Halocatena halophila TaxID=2814576 RepID=UPI002ED3743B
MSPNNTADKCRINDGFSDESVQTRIRGSSATGEIDESLVEILAWILETDTRARIYLYLRQQPGVTSEAIATGTGLYPSTVRETLAVLVDEGTVMRNEEPLNGVEGSTYIYEAISPEQVVLDAADTIQERLNTVFRLDELLGVAEDRTSSNLDRSISIDRTNIEESVPVSVTIADDERGEGS